MERGEARSGGLRQAAGEGIGRARMDGSTKREYATDDKSISFEIMDNDN